MDSASTIIRCPACGKANRVRPVPSGVPRCAACHASLPWIVDASASSFGAETDASVPVLLDFWAPWCGPCRAVSPLLERVARSRAGHLKLVKINTDEEPALAQRFGVQGIPLMVLLRDGTEIDRRVGALPERALEQWLEPHIAAGAH